MSKRYSIFLTALFCAFLGGMALLSLLLPIISAIRKSRKPVAANVESTDSSAE